MTRVRSASGVYPAVDALVTLAADVKAIVGAGTKVTYGADWTEYGAHVVDPGASEVRFPLDPLWASSAIDAVGIDYYAPLADWRDDANASRPRAQRQPVPDRLSRRQSGARRRLRLVLRRRRCARERRRARRSPTGSASRGCSGRRTSGTSGRSRITSASAASSWQARPRGSPQSKPVWLTEIGCPGGRQGRQSAERVSRSEVVGIGVAVFFRRQPRRPDPAPHAGSRARRFRSGLRRRRAQSGLAGLWRPHDRARRASICGPGTPGRFRCFRRRPTYGATAPTGRPAIG